MAQSITSGLPEFFHDVIVVRVTATSAYNRNNLVLKKTDVITDESINAGIIGSHDDRGSVRGAGGLRTRNAAA